MRVMITGGGTAGHTSPAVAIIEELQKRDSRLDLQWVGRRGGIEERVCDNLTIPFRSVAVRGWPRSGIVRRAVALARLVYGGFQAYVHLLRFRPQAVIGVGGYVSVPLVWIAQRRGIPTILHEQNKRLGMANRLLAARADKLLLSFPDTIGPYPEGRAIVVGNPVRSGFLEPPDRESACEKLGLDSDVPIVLVVGGSQGARTLNEAMAGAVNQFQPGEAQFVWMCGAHGVDMARKAAERAPVPVSVYSYIDDMATAFAASTMLVSRAGASSTAEIATVGKPSILVPYPYATDNHQEANARAFEAAGASIVILDEDCTADRLAEDVRALLSDPGRLEEMSRAARTMARPAAVETIVESVFEAVFPEARS